MKWFIDDSIRYKQSGSFEDVVYSVRYCFEETGSSCIEGQYNIVAIKGHYGAPRVDEENFIPYENVTTSSFKEWIQDSYGSEWGEYTSSIQERLISNLESRVNHKASIVHIWPGGEQTIDIPDWFERPGHPRLARSTYAQGGKPDDKIGHLKKTNTD